MILIFIICLAKIIRNILLNSKSLCLCIVGKKQEKHFLMFVVPAELLC